MENHSGVETLVEQITTGFAALASEYSLLREEHRQLESKLSWAKQQHSDIIFRLNPQNASEETQKFLDELQAAGQAGQERYPHWLDGLSNSDVNSQNANADLIRNAEAACENLKARYANAKGQVKIWKGPSADKDISSSISTPSRQASGKFRNLERDFTISGTPSKLGCPFNQRAVTTEAISDQQSLRTPRSSTSKIGSVARRSKRPSFVDPIKAEVGCAHETQSQAASIEGSAAVCPIRFLAQHSPEEVAQYFENHKHELPRSHEVCVKRFQSNTDSIRQLDAKYGNLVSMIQGLGEKHQAWLPEQPEDEEDEAEGHEVSDKIQDWAKAISSSIGVEVSNDPEKVGELGDEGREPHFDRPLKEIRVGESPSRPWGISIPAKFTEASTESPLQSPLAAKPLLVPNGHPSVSPSGAKHCPFSYLKSGTKEENAPKNPLPQGEPDQKNEKEDFPSQKHVAQVEPPKAGAQYIFNGPVFFGYLPDQIATLLQSSSVNSQKL